MNIRTVVRWSVGVALGFAAGLGIGLVGSEDIMNALRSKVPPRVWTITDGAPPDWYSSVVAEGGYCEPVVLVSCGVVGERPLNYVSFGLDGTTDYPIRMSVNNVSVRLPTEPSVFFEDCGRLERIEMTADDALRLMSDLKHGRVRLKALIEDSGWDKREGKDKGSGTVSLAEEERKTGQNYFIGSSAR